MRRVRRRCTRRWRRRPSGRNLEPALEIFADIVLRPHLDEEEVEPIRALCLQNLRSLEDDPGTKVIYELRRRHFPDPWGRPSPGSAEGVASLTPDDLRRFWEANYRPNGAILGVAGAIDWPRLRDAVGRLFGAGRRGPSRRSASGPPGRAATTSSARPSRSRSRWPSPAATVDSPEYYAARAAVAILGGYSSARLFTEVREKRGLVLLGLRQLRGPSRPRRAALLRRHVRRPGAADPRRDAGRARAPRPATASRSRSWRPCGRA